MPAYSPPYQISDKILSLVAAISEKVGRVAARRELESKPRLRRNNRIRSIHSSLKIEANSLSLNEVRNIIDGHPVLGPGKEIQEVKNAYAAYEEIKTLNPFDISELKRLHGIMTKFLVEESGEFRRGEGGVFNGDQCIFVAPPAFRVPDLIADLFAWMNNNLKKVHPLVMSAVFHYEFVFIHPFSDGNGRMARLWHTAILAKWNPIFEFIPLESQIEKFQDEYYHAIEDCHEAGNSNGFIEFILEQIEAVIDEILERDDTQNDTQNDTLSDTLKERILALIDENEQITRQKLADKLGVSKSTITREIKKIENLRHIGSSKNGCWEIF